MAQKTPQQIQAEATAARQAAEQRQSETRKNRSEKSQAVRDASGTLQATNSSLSRARVKARSAKTLGERTEAQAIVKGFEGNRAEQRRAYDMALNRARRIGANVDPKIVALHRTGRSETPQPAAEAPKDTPKNTPVAPGVTGGQQSATARTPKTTRSVTPRKRDYTVDAKNAKSNTVLGKALKMYGDPRKGPDKTGEMLQDGAKSPHHVTLTGKEFQSFKKAYIAKHRGSGGANLSDWSLRAMAKMLKYKNSDTLRKTYGLGEHKPPSEG